MKRNFLIVRHQDPKVNPHRYYLAHLAEDLEEQTVREAVRSKKDWACPICRDGCRYLFTPLEEELISLYLETRPEWHLLYCEAKPISRYYLSRLTIPVGKKRIAVQEVSRVGGEKLPFNLDGVYIPQRRTTTKASKANQQGER